MSAVPPVSGAVLAGGRSRRMGRDKRLLEVDGEALLARTVRVLGTVADDVTVVVAERQVRVLYAGQEVACHAQSPLRRTSVIDRRHLAGIVGGQHAGVSWLPKTPPPPPVIPAELLRPLEQYEAALGGAW